MSRALALSVGREVGVGARDERRVVQVGALEVGDEVEAAQVERGRQPVDLAVADPELADEQVEDVVVHVLVDLEAHRRAEPATGQLLLQGGEEVLGVVLLDLEVLVAGDPEGEVLVHLHPGEELVEVGGDDVLERHEPGVEQVGYVAGSPGSGSMCSSRGSSGGTLTRAKCSLPVLGLTSTTARLSDSPEM